MAGAPDGNNSGTDGPAPPAVVAMGRCWPARVLGRWFTRLNNLADLPCEMQGLPRSTYLVEHGYEAAWRHRRFESVAQFRTSMRWWRVAAASYVLLQVAVLLGLVSRSRELVW